MIFYFIGYMGSGKTTYGRILSEQLGLDFLDLDRVIVDNERMDIKEIFACKGEKGFREEEKRSLHRITEEKGNRIIAVGGGTPCFFDNMEYMNSHGKTVYLKASISRLVKNIKEDGTEKRPLVAGKSEKELRVFVEEKLRERMPYYMKANYVFETDGITSENLLSRFRRTVDLQLL